MLFSFGLAASLVEGKLALLRQKLTSCHILVVVEWLEKYTHPAILNLALLSLAQGPYLLSLLLWSGHHTKYLIGWLLLNFGIDDFTMTWPQVKNLLSFT